MTISFTKTFPDYTAADAWLHEHGYDGAVINIDHRGAVTVTLTGETARIACEAETAAKVHLTEAA